MRKMLISAVHPEEYRVAIVEDGLLEEFNLETFTGGSQSLAFSRYPDT